MWADPLWSCSKSKAKERPDPYPGVSEPRALSDTSGAGDVTTEVALHTAVHELCGMGVAEVMGGVEASQSREWLISQMSPLMGQPLEYVIIVMSRGACQGMWSGRLLL